MKIIKQKINVYEAASIKKSTFDHPTIFLFGLLSLFNGMLMFVGYLMLKSFLLKDSCSIIKHLENS